MPLLNLLMTSAPGPLVVVSDRSVNRCELIICLSKWASPGMEWLDSNRRPLELEATTLPTEPQPLPWIISFLNRPFPASFFFIFVFSINLTVNIQYTFYRLLDSNHGPLELEATALPTEPVLFSLFNAVNYQYIFLPMTEFELRTSEARSNHSTNWDTTTALNN